MTPIRDHNLYSDPDHTYAQFMEQLTPATIWLFASIYSIAYWVFCRSGLNLYKFFKCYAYKDLDNDAFTVPLDDDEYTFFEHLKKRDLKAWKKQEEDIRGKYGI